MATYPDRGPAGRRHRGRGHRGGGARPRGGRPRKAASGSSSRTALIGGAAIDAHGDAAARADASGSAGRRDAILFGAVGGPKWDHLRPEQRPERGILRIRKELDLYANLRPARLYPMLVDSLAAQAVGRRGRRPHGHPRADGRPLLRRAARNRGERPTAGARVNTMVYTAREIERIADLAFQVARGRRQRLTSVDKSNVLVVSQLWREVVTDVGRRYPDVAARPPAGRQLRHGAGGRPAAVRHDRDREHVRRHPVGRGRDHRGLDGHAAVGEPRPGARRPAGRALRADPRDGAGHRRAGHRQPARGHPVGGDAAALLAGPPGRRRARGAGRRADAGGGVPDARTSTRPGTTLVGTTAMGDR